MVHGYSSGEDGSPTNNNTIRITGIVTKRIDFGTAWGLEFTNEGTGKVMLS